MEESATYLIMPKSTFYRLFRGGTIPSHKIDRHWRFRKVAIDHWLEERRTSEPGSGRNR